MVCIYSRAACESSKSPESPKVVQHVHAVWPKEARSYLIVSIQMAKAKPTMNAKKAAAPTPKAMKAMKAKKAAASAPKAIKAMKANKAAVSAPKAMKAKSRKETVQEVVEVYYDVCPDLGN